MCVGVCVSQKVDMSQLVTDIAVVRQAVRHASSDCKGNELPGLSLPKKVFWHHHHHLCHCGRDCLICNHWTVCVHICDSFCELCVLQSDS